MKQYAILLTVFTLVTALGLCICYLLTGNDRDSRAQVIIINDIVETVKENPDHPEKLRETQFGEPFLFYDADGSLLYASPDAETEDYLHLRDAVRNGALCIPAADRTRFFGTVALQNTVNEIYQKKRNRLFLIYSFSILVFVLIAACFGIYVQRKIILPFRRMKAFAGSIAGGRFDEPLLREKDNMFGIFTESFDIMREELNASHQRERALKQREKELVASLSHDLKTPLTGIKLLCELLSVKSKDAYMLGKIAEIGQKAEQMHVLVNDLLTTTLDDLGKMHVHCRYESSAILHALIAEQDVRSLTRETPIPECLIYTDPQRLGQVIGNILSNSYKYAGTEIDVRFRIAGDYLEASFSDYGTGVPDDELCLLTQKFYRGSQAAEKEGSGLGLYIADQLMEQMNGGLICSGGAHGLTVTLRISLNG